MTFGRNAMSSDFPFANPNPSDTPAAPAPSALKRIKVGINNRADDSLGGKTSKYDVGAILFYQDGTMTHDIPHTLALEVPAGTSTHPPIEWDVPDKTPVSVRFVWNERHGNTVVYRAAVFNRDSSSIGSPWNSLFLGFDADNLSGKGYEYVMGGISVTP